MWRGAYKEIPLKVKGDKRRAVAGLKRSRHIIYVELSLPRSYLEFKAGQTGHNGPARWTRLPQF
jgi:hypothetical protein